MSKVIKQVVETYKESVRLTERLLDLFNERARKLCESYKAENGQNVCDHPLGQEFCEIENCPLTKSKEKIIKRVAEMRKTGYCKGCDDEKNPLCLKCW